MGRSVMSSSSSWIRCSSRSKRSEEHTSELQSQSNLVCRLLLEKKKISFTDHPFQPTIRIRFCSTCCMHINCHEPYCYRENCNDLQNSHDNITPNHALLSIVGH